MKTRRMVQALYDLLCCDYSDTNDIAVPYGGLLTKIERDRSFLLGAVDANAKIRQALLDFLGVEVKHQQAGIRIVKTKKAKGTKRA